MCEFVVYCSRHNNFAAYLGKNVLFLYSNEMPQRSGIRNRRHVDDLLAIPSTKRAFIDRRLAVQIGRCEIGQRHLIVA